MPLSTPMSSRNTFTNSPHAQCSAQALKRCDAVQKSRTSESWDVEGKKWQSRVTVTEMDLSPLPGSIQYIPGLLTDPFWPESAVLCQLQVEESALVRRSPLDCNSKMAV